jgi:hypothetical protein
LRGTKNFYFGWRIDGNAASFLALHNEQDYCKLARYFLGVNPVIFLNIFAALPWLSSPQAKNASAMLRFVSASIFLMRSTLRFLW